MIYHALHTEDNGVCNSSYFENRQLVVSLTTYGKRLYEVYLTIESIMQQTVKPNRIILWLADDLQGQDVPHILKRQETRGLEIRYCKDIKSYKKLIPSLKECPEDFILTIDDDVIYEFDMIENLIKSYQQAPGFVYANRVRQMVFDDEGQLAPYRKWKLMNRPMEDSVMNIPTGVGGVLYPPHCFNDEVFNEQDFMNICSHADDVWFKCMCLQNGMNSRLALVHEPVYYENESVQDVALYNTNVNKNDNDRQILSVFGKYNLYSKLK